MGRLIDADELRKKFYNYTTESGIQVALDRYAVSCVDNAPTVDAVEVVRCQDCRWWDKKDGANYGYCHAAKHGYFSKHWEISIYRTYKPDFYCVDGERKEE